MVKRRRKAARRAPVRRAAKRAPVRRRRKSSSMGGLKNAVQMDSMLYGGLRARMSNALIPLTSKIPLGTISDEVGMGLANWFIAKNTSGLVKNIALKGLVIENARLGEAIATNGTGLLSFGTSKSAPTPYMYG